MRTSLLLTRLTAILIVFMVMMLPTHLLCAANNPLCFTARNGSVSVRFDIKNVTYAFQYSTDGKNWIHYNYNSTVTINANENVYFQATSTQSTANAYGNRYDNNSSRFYFTSADGGTVECSGDIRSLYGPTCPDLPLQQYAFAYMFYNCTLLTSAPSLYYWQLAGYCYYNMFAGCTSLLTTPALPATSTQQYCYSNMFRGCTSLTTVTSLPATILANYCYFEMFKECTSLTTVPSLSATYLSSHSCDNMFYGCSSLVVAPSLPATTLADYCYNGMFASCTALTNAPVLPATSLAKGCYSSMFAGCTVLANAPVLPATNLSESCYYNMFASCDSLTVAPALPAMSLERGCYYKMFFCCNNLTSPPVLPATTLAPYCYVSMFESCVSLINAPSLPATNLAEYCYAYMFASCLSLTNPPILPATKLENMCYQNMFSHCALLKTPPLLPATKLVSHCYQRMFYYCTSLESTTTMLADTMANHCCNEMYSFCTSLTAALELPATFLDTSCYEKMFSYCTSLIISPKLPAAILADGCYANMFEGCTSLRVTPLLPADSLSNYCYAFMFDGCTSLLVPPILSASTLANSCYLGMFYNCSSMEVNTNGPGKQWAIIANASANNALDDMFEGSGGTMNGTPSINTAYYIASGQHTLTVNINNSTMGRVVGAGTYVDGEEATLTAQPNLHYHFVNWSNGNTSQTISMTVLGDSVLTAFFAVNQYSITAYTNNTTMGSTSGSGLYDYGTTATLIAVANTGYHFVSWSNGMTSDTISVQVLDNSSLTAIFAVNQTYSISETNSICLGDTFIWHNKCLTESGVFIDSLKTRYGSDSIHQLTLIVNPTFFFQENHTICQGENYLWHNRFLSSSGVYYDSLQTLNGCDSVYELTLTVNPSYVIEEYMSICQGCSYNWHNKSLTKEGIYYDSLQTMFGCDSVYKLTLTVNPTFFIEESDTICQGSSFLWHGQVLTAEGVYYDSLTSISGCDSVYELTLALNPSFIFKDEHTICQGEAYKWRNKSLTIAGVYYDSLATELGCDSVYELTLVVNPTYFIQEIDFICHGDAYNWHNKSLTSSGVYYDSLKTTEGCDSIYELTLTFSEFTLTLNVNDSAMGSVGGACVYECGDTATLTATANANNHFVSWSNGTTTATINIVVSKDSTLTATFAIDTHNVTAIPNDSTMGDVTGAGTYNYGSTSTLTATPNTNYHFVSWSNGAMTPIINIVVSKDSTLTAYFAINQHNVTAIPNDGTMGNVTGGGTYDYGTNVTLTATPNEHYHFVDWSNGEITTTINVVLTGDTALTANFAVDQHIVTVVSNDNTMGGVSGGGSYGYGTSATITATPNEHYHFVNWSNGETSATINVTVICDSTLTAYFEIDKHTITALSNNDNYGVVAGGGVFDYGTTVTLTATPNEHYVFTGWDNGATNPTLTIVLDKDSTVEAIFAPIQYNVVATANYNNRGVVTGSGSYDYGMTAALTATPNEGFVFTAWSNGATSNTIFVHVESDTALTAMFDPITSSVDDVEGTEYIVYSNENNIHINGAAGEPIRIYDINGKLISEIEEASDEQIVSVYVAGVYFVRINEKKSIKVVVK